MILVHAIIFTLLLSFSIAAQDIVLVVSRENPIKTVTINDIKKLYIGKQTTLDNVFMHPAVIKSDEIHSAFLKQYLNINTRQFARTWQKLVFTGRAQMPKQFSTVQELIDAITANPNTIGYINKSDLTDAVRELEVLK